MSIDFTYTPTQNRNPGATFEVESNASTNPQIQRTLLLGHMGTGIAQAGAGALSAPNQSTAAAYWGVGSMLYEMWLRVRQQDPTGEIWGMAIAVPNGGNPASGTVQIQGTATTGGEIDLYIAGQKTVTAVRVGDTGAAVLARFYASLAAQAYPDLPVAIPNAAPAGGAALALSCAWGGLTGNDIDMRVNYRGAAGGESLPGGLTVTLTPFAGGTGSPATLAASLATLAYNSFDYIALPFTDTGSLDAVKLFMSEQTGRWSPTRMLYGHCFASIRATLATATTFLAARNDKHVSIMPAFDVPEPSWIWAADLAGTCGASLRNDPVLPLQYLEMGVLPPPEASRWGFDEHNVLLYDGGSTFDVDADGTVVIGRVVTNSLTNQAGVPDDSYLDAETLASLAYVCRDLRSFLLTQFPRFRLVSDATRISRGTKAVNPMLIKQSVILRYRYLEEEVGLVMDTDTFAAGLRVEPAGKGRVNLYLPVILAGQLRQMAVLVDFSKPL